MQGSTQALASMVTASLPSTSLGLSAPAMSKTLSPLQPQYQFGSHCSPRSVSPQPPGSGPICAPKAGTSNVENIMQGEPDLEQQLQFPPSKNDEEGLMISICKSVLHDRILCKTLYTVHKYVPCMGLQPSKYDLGLSRASQVTRLSLDSEKHFNLHATPM